MNDMSDIVFLLIVLAGGCVMGALTHRIAPTLGPIASLFVGCCGALVCAVLLVEFFAVQRSIALAAALALAPLNVYATGRWDWGSSATGSSYSDGGFSDGSC